MKVYYYSVIPNSTKAGYDTTIQVYHQGPKTKQFYRVGYDNEINRGAHYGDTSIVSNILHKELGYRMVDEHKLLRKDIKIVKFPELSLI